MDILYFQGLIFLCVMLYMYSKLKEQEAYTGQAMAKANARLSYDECFSIINDIIENHFAFKVFPTDKLEKSLFDFDKELRIVNREIIMSLSRELINNTTLFVTEDYLFEYIVKSCRNMMINKTLLQADKVNMRR